MRLRGMLCVVGLTASVLLASLVLRSSTDAATAKSRIGVHAQLTQQEPGTAQVQDQLDQARRLFPDPEPSREEQLNRLATWYSRSPADAPNGRPILSAEVVFCDFSAILTGAAPVQTTLTFASAEVSLSDALTDTELADTCLSSQAQVLDVSATRSRVLTTAEWTSTAGGRPSSDVCAASLRGPVVDPAYEVRTVSLKPVVVLGGTSCKDAGYEEFTLELAARINAQRDTEIAIRAVPRECPTAEEAAAWTQLEAFRRGQTLAPVVRQVPYPSEGRCWNHMIFDWDAGTVGIQ